METKFDLPQRVSSEESYRKRDALFSQIPFWMLLKDLPEMILILSDTRQIVYYNDSFREYTGALDDLELIDKRLGEVLQCRNREGDPHGCGTTEQCECCGAGQAIFNTRLLQKKQYGECNMIVERDQKEEALSLEVYSNPLFIGDELFYVLSIRDIMTKKHEHALDRTFFHDILNSVSSLRGLVDILPQADEVDFESIHGRLKQIVSQVIDEILFQRELKYAETGHLLVRLRPVSLQKVFSAVKDFYGLVADSQEVILHFILPESNLHANSDKVLLVRSLSNLVKNALESSGPGDEVVVFAEQTGEHVTIAVQNRRPIPESVRNSIFKRFATTKKERGRGIGTYSVKLFVEQYLAGKVDFTSSDEEGTIFTITIPVAEE